MKKLFAIVIYYCCLNLSAQTNTIQIDSSMQKAILDFACKNETPHCRTDSGMNKYEWPMLILNNKQIYEALYHHTIHKTIITNEVRYYSVDCNRNLTLSNGHYILIRIKAAEPPIPNNQFIGCIAINNSLFFLTGSAKEHFGNYLMLSDSKINIQITTLLDIYGVLDGFERCHYYLIAETGELYSYSLDYFPFVDTEMINDYFIKIEY